MPKDLVRGVMHSKILELKLLDKRNYDLCQRRFLVSQKFKQERRDVNSGGGFETALKKNMHYEIAIIHRSTLL